LKEGVTTERVNESLMSCGDCTGFESGPNGWPRLAYFSFKILL
jgi:hypothetical protein